VDTLEADPAWVIRTSPEPDLMRSSAPATPTVMSPEPVSTWLGPPHCSSSTSPEPDFSTQLAIGPAAVMPAEPVRMRRSECSGTVMVTSSSDSPPKKPVR